MRTGSRRLRALAFAAGLALFAACFQLPDFSGPYRCQTKDDCGDGFACDDGLCCVPGGSPSCPTLVTDGFCDDGGRATPMYPDLDGDGYGNPLQRKLVCGSPVLSRYVAVPFDCNDNPEGNGASDHPDASEQCDGVDNDCDGERDEGLARTLFFEDQDRDGFGNPDASVLACRPPPDLVTNGLDCADNLGDVRPTAAEVCNNKDDNCSGEVDETVKRDWCRDADGDGFGAKASVTPSCDRPGPNFILDCSDCNDGNPNIHPNAQDRCDGIDNNCSPDGGIDERPDCGGPSNLLSDNGGFVRGAQNLNKTPVFGPELFRCQAHQPLNTSETFLPPGWSGTGSNAHIFYVETDRGWDLTKNGLDIHLAFDHTIVNPRQADAGGPFGGGYQPIVYLCDGDGGHVRYVPNDAGTGLGRPILSFGGQAVDETFPLGGGNGWVIGSNSGNLDSSRVTRIEVMIDWAKPTSGEPTFNVIFSPGGFGFQ